MKVERNRPRVSLLGSEDCSSVSDHSERAERDFSRPSRERIQGVEYRRQIHRDCATVVDWN